MTIQMKREDTRKTSNALPHWLLFLFIFVVTTTTLWPFWLGLAPRADHAYMLRDMMVPYKMALNDPALGIGDHAPRAVPQDTILGAISTSLPASFVAALAVLCAAGSGIFNATRMARDMAGASKAAQLTVALFVVWNPFIIERLLQGQWTFAMAAMLLPSVAYYSASGVRSGQLVILAACGLTPTGLILGAITALVFDQSWQRRGVTAIAALGLSSPWLMVSLINGSAQSSDPQAAAAFAVGADNPLGTVASVLGLGGIWNAGAVPPSRGLFAGIAGVLLFALFATGFRELFTIYRPVAIVTVCAFVIPLLLGTPPGITLTGWAIENIPGTALFRDTQKLVALAIPGVVLMMCVSIQQVQKFATRQAQKDFIERVESGNKVSRTSTMLSQMNWSRVVTLTFVVLIIGTVPAYPRDISPTSPQPISPAWDQVMNTVAGSPSGKVLLLPPGNYRLRADRQPTLTPALKMVPGSPIDPQYLIVDGQLIDGDPEAIDLLRATLDGRDILARSGVGWVLVDRPSIIHPETFEEVETVLSKYNQVMDIDGIELYRISNPLTQPRAHSTIPTWVGMGIYWLITMGGVWALCWRAFQAAQAHRARRRNRKNDASESPATANDSRE